MYFWWPWNSLRRAYVIWQALEARLLAAREELARRHQDLCRVAESLQVKPNLGILRAAQLALDTPLDPVALKSRRHLEKAFAFLGKSLGRRAPAALQRETRRYAGHVDEMCRTYGEVGARLLSAGKIIDIFRLNPEFGAADNYRLALISPEAAWLVYHLQQNRAVERLANKNCLVQGWRTRVATCRRWLGLLQDSFPVKTFNQLERKLQDLAEKEAARGEYPDVSELFAGHAKLDLLNSVANRQATRIIADLLGQKTN